MDLMTINTRNSFSGPAGDNVLVDKFLGSNYDVVRKVATNIDAIKDLNSNKNIGALTENYADVKKALDAAPELQAVGQNLTAVLDSSKQAAKAAQSAKSAVATLSEIKTLADEVQTTADKTQQLSHDLNEVATNVATVADNIGAVLDVANNITDINTINTVLDDDRVVTAIKNINTNLTSIDNISDNLDELLELYNAVVTTGDSDKITQALEEIKANLKLYQQVLTEIRGEVTNFELKTAEFDTEVRNQIRNIQDEASRQMASLREVQVAIERYQEELDATTEKNEEIQNDCNNLLLQIKDIYHSAEEAINKALTKAITQLTLKTDEQYARIRTEGDAQVNRLHNTLDTAVHEAIDELKELAQDLGDSQVSDIQDAVTEIKDQAIADFTAEKDKILAEVQDKVDGVTVDISDLTNRVEEVEDTIADSLDRASYDTVGVTELATTDEVRAGTSDSTVITPFNLRQGLSEVLIEIFQRAHPDLTNNVVQQIVETIVDDPHLVEPLKEALGLEGSSISIDELVSRIEAEERKSAQTATDIEDINDRLDELESNTSGYSFKVNMPEVGQMTPGVMYISQS